MTTPLMGLVGAIQFLTRIPIRTRSAVEHARIVAWFPVVGAMIGLATGSAVAGLTEWLSPTVAASLTIIFGLLITGAFHEDGLGDIADAFGGGWTRQERFEILKDSRHGTYGVAALSGSIVLRVTALGSIVSPAAAFAGLIAAHTLGRTAAVAAIAVAPPATQGGLGADSVRALRRGRAALGVLSGVGIAAAATGWWVVPLAGVSVVGTAGVVWLAIRKLGGIAGDVLGAVEQVVECLVLVVVSGLASRHDVWWK